MTPSFDPQTQRLLDSIRDRAAWAEETLLKWSAINSGSTQLQALAHMRDEVSTTFAQLGRQLEVIDLPPQRVLRDDGEVVDQPVGATVRVTTRPQAPHQVVLTGHYDTVFAADHPFQEPWLDGEHMRGPGVADMKGGLLAMWLALSALEDSALRDAIGYQVLLNPDEEIGSPGSVGLLTAAAKQAHLGLTYEPALADGGLAGARKGSGNFAFLVRGKAAHAGREPELGRNAIAKVAELVSGLFALNDYHAGISVNPARIEGGGATNIPAW